MVVLQQITRESFRSIYEPELHLAIQLQLGFAAAMGVSTADAARFFRQLSRHVKHPPVDSDSPTQQHAYTHPSAADLRAYHEQNSEVFDHFILDTWLQLQITELDEKLGWLLEWRDENRKIIRKYRATALTESELWPVFMMLLLLTNNRIGLTNGQHALSAYLISEALISNSKPPARTLSSEA